MPELVEIELYRRAVDVLVGRRVRAVAAPDPWFVKGGIGPGDLADALEGVRLTGTRRIGKLLLVDTDGPTLGLRFGMTGLVEVDGRRPIAELRYSSTRRDPAWVRFGLDLAPGGLVVVDPRRLGGVQLDPDESALGPDAATVGPAALRDALAGSAAPLKARLLDQARLAGVGNLMADEVLWRAGLDPRRPAGGLDDRELRRLHRHLRRVAADLLERGGSHTGDIIDHRVPGGACPRDGAALTRDVVGGRTTWWCPAHQH